jgi:opacity protein-like surface antigen
MRLWSFSRVTLSRLVLLFILLWRASHVGAESYIAGQVGLTMPLRATSIEVSGGPLGFPDGTTSSDRDLKNSIVYGLKLGHYFESSRWLGIETEVFHANPHVKQQSVTVTLPPGFIFVPPGSRSVTAVSDGSYLRVVTWATNLVVRYPGTRVQPYAGVGLGVFFVRTNDAGDPDSQSSISPGLNVLAGLRVLLTDHVAIFGEWKFNHTRFSFDGQGNAPPFDATYNAHHTLFGVGYHF